MTDKAKIAVLSVENANLKICVEDLKTELENKNVELVGMRGACESYKMHYDNAQAEIENKNVEIDILIRKKEALRDEISELSAKVERLQHKISDLQHGILNCKSEAIREFGKKIPEIFIRYAHLHNYAEQARKDEVESAEGVKIEMQSVWDVISLNKYGMAEYEEMSELQKNIEILAKERLLTELEKDFRLLVKEMVGDVK